MQIPSSKQWLGLVVVTAACAGSTPPAPGNVALGITHFEITETAIKSTVIGLDANNQQVGKLELVHGRYIMPPGSESAFEGREVDGRMLNAVVGGHSLEWSTIGYADTTHMPPLPGNEAVTAAFLADPHVRPILDRWLIAWGPGANPASARGEQAYDVDCDWGEGTSYDACSLSTMTCPIQQSPGTTPYCNGNAAISGLSYHGGVYGDMVSQCCGTCSGKDSCVGTFAEKACAQSGTATQCGDNGQKCKPCFTVSFSDHCSVYPIDAGGGLYQTCHDYL